MLFIFPRPCFPNAFAVLRSLPKLAVVSSYHCGNSREIFVESQDRFFINCEAWRTNGKHINGCNKRHDHDSIPSDLMCQGQNHAHVSRPFDYPFTRKCNLCQIVLSRPSPRNLISEREVISILYKTNSSAIIQVQRFLSI